MPQTSDIFKTSLVEKFEMKVAYDIPESDDTARRLATLQSLEQRLTSYAVMSKKQQQNYSRMDRAWRLLVRILTLGCVIMGALVGSESLSRNAAAALGLALAITNSISGTINEIVNKISKKLQHLHETSTTVLMAKIKLMKAYDQAMDDEKISAKEFQDIIDSMTAAIKAVSDHKDHKV